MSNQQTPPEQDSLVAAINSTPAGRDLDRLALIDEARSRGIPWSAIGTTLGMSGREAKRHAHHLAKRAGRAWRLQQNQKARLQP